MKEEITKNFAFLYVIVVVIFALKAISIGTALIPIAIALGVAELVLWCSYWLSLSRHWSGSTGRTLAWNTVILLLLVIFLLGHVCLFC